MVQDLAPPTLWPKGSLRDPILLILLQVVRVRCEPIRYLPFGPLPSTKVVRVEGVDPSISTC